MNAKRGASAGNDRRKWSTGFKIEGAELGITDVIGKRSGLFAGVAREGVGE